jgi:predicted nucleic acid-binding protein
MDRVFLDTNSLLKLYLLSEVGSSWLRNYILGKKVVISELSLFETLTVARRLYVEGKLTFTESSDMFNQILRERVNYNIVPMGGEPQLRELSNIVFGLANNLRLRALWIAYN